MKSFQSRPPIPIALIGILVLIMMLVAAYNIGNLPLVGHGRVYHAEFSNAAGLRSGDPVKIAGVVVGHVQSVSLEADHVEVGFDAGHEWVGELSTASVQLNTLLGQRYLQVAPKGSHELSSSVPIPLSRTETPYEIVPTLNKLSRTVGDIDVAKVRKAFDSVSSTFAGTQGDVHQAVTGLSRLSLTVANRDERLRELLSRSNKVTSTLADRDMQIGKLITDLNPLLTELKHRRTAIHQLLVGAQSLSGELDGLVADNQATLRPALAHLSKVSAVLANNQKNLDAGIRVLGPYVHLFTNTVGVGRWFDAYVCGLIPPPVAGVNTKGC